nr:MAG TPA: hypothetical protein [Herelleviridae sp.]DAO29258.1 MAG TPA: hypothetical protein [Caudoviricetes sp.]
MPTLYSIQFAILNTVFGYILLYRLDYIFTIIIVLSNFHNQ